MPPRGKDKKPRKRREHPEGFAKNQNPDLPDGYNTKRIQFMLAILPSEPVDKGDVGAMRERFYRYLKMCAEWDMKIGNLAAYAAMGITKADAYEWTNRNTGNKERTALLKEVQQVCGMYREGLMNDGKVNPVTGIFWQKNYDGLRDQQEVVVTPNNPLGEVTNAEQLSQKYLESTYGQIEDKSSGQTAQKVIEQIPETVPEVIAETPETN